MDASITGGVRSEPELAVVTGQQPAAQRPLTEACEEEAATCRQRQAGIELAGEPTARVVRREPELAVVSGQQPTAQCSLTEASEEEDAARREEEAAARRQKAARIELAAAAVSTAVLKLAQCAVEDPPNLSGVGQTAEGFSAALESTASQAGAELAAARRQALADNAAAFEVASAELLSAVGLQDREPLRRPLLESGIAAADRYATPALTLVSPDHTRTQPQASSLPSLPQPPASPSLQPPQPPASSLQPPASSLLPNPATS